METLVRNSPEAVLPDAPETVPRITDEHALHGDEYDPAIAKIIEKKYKRHSRLNRLLAGTAIATTLLAPVDVFYADVRANKAQAALSTPELDQIIGADTEAQPDDSALFYLAGFDTTNGSVFGERVGIAYHQITPGKDISVDYGDAPLDPEEIGKKIITYSDENNVDEISLAGNSLGGIVTFSVVEYIIENSDIQVKAVYPNATPDGTKGLKPQTKEDLSSMLSWVNAIDGAKYSNYVRYAATMGQGVDRFTHGDSIFENVEDFINVSNETIDLIQEKRRPGMWLLVDQALALSNADLKNIITKIGSMREDKYMPVIAVSRTANPDDDTVVDVEMSSENICMYATEAGLECTISYVEGASHTSWDYDTDAYTKALAVNAEEIKDSIEREELRYNLAQYGLLGSDASIGG